ncbi:MAG: response regulator [Pseudomonadota bacterium]
MKNGVGPKIRVKILAVDDEKDITDLIVRYFTFKGYDIIGLNDPVEALGLVEEKNFQVIISDIVMPGMDGLEFLRKIKEHNGGIQVIMITGHVTMHNILTAMRLGAETIFFKPLQDLDELETAIGGCIDKIAMWQDILKKLGAMGRTDQPNA